RFLPLRRLRRRNAESVWRVWENVRRSVSALVLSNGFRGVRVLQHAGVPLFIYFLFFCLRSPFFAGSIPFSARYAAIARLIDSASGVPCSAFSTFSPASNSSGIKTATRRIQVSIYAC